MAYMTVWLAVLHVKGELFLLTLCQCMTDNYTHIQQPFIQTVIYTAKYISNVEKEREIVIQKSGQQYIATIVCMYINMHVTMAVVSACW